MKITLAEPLNITDTILNEFSSHLTEQGHTFQAYDTLWKDNEELIHRCENSDIVIIANHPFSKEVIDQLPDLKMIDVAFTGIDHVAQDACRNKNIMICNAAGYSTVAVSELVIGMAIHALRNLSKAEHAVRTGGTSAGIGGREIYGKTVGIIGTGAIGSSVAKLFLAFGAKVIAYNRSEKEELKQLGVVYKSLEDVLHESDIISIHVPNNNETKDLINKDRIALMKTNAILINCARGPIVDNKALSDALNHDRIGFACIDVFDMEPPLPEDYPLLHAKNTFLTPHQGFISEEAMVRRAKIVFDNIDAYLKGNPVNVCK